MKPPNINRGLVRRRFRTLGVFLDDPGTSATSEDWTVLSITNDKSLTNYLTTEFYLISLIGVIPITSSPEATTIR